MKEIKKSKQKSKRLSDERLVKKVHKEVEAMKPETTVEAKAYFRAVWKKYEDKGIPIIYYPNGRG